MNIFVCQPSVPSSFAFAHLRPRPWRPRHGVWMCMLHTYAPCAQCMTHRMYAMSPLLCRTPSSARSPRPPIFLSKVSSAHVPHLWHCECAFNRTPQAHLYLVHRTCCRVPYRDSLRARRKCSFPPHAPLDRLCRSRAATICRQRC